MWMRKWPLYMEVNRRKTYYGKPIDVTETAGRDIVVLMEQPAADRNAHLFIRGLVLRLTPKGDMRRLTQIMPDTMQFRDMRYNGLLPLPDGQLVVMAQSIGHGRQTNFQINVTLDTADRAVEGFRFKPETDTSISAVPRGAALARFGNVNRMHTLAVSQQGNDRGWTQNLVRVVWPGPGEPLPCGMDLLPVVTRRGTFPAADPTRLDWLVPNPTVLEPTPLALSPAEICPPSPCQERITRAALFPNDFTFCAGQRIGVELRPTIAGQRRLWSNRSQSSAIWVDRPGAYGIRVEDGCFTYLDTAHVRVSQGAVPTLVMQAGPDATCAGDSVQLRAMGLEPIVWSDGRVGTRRWARAPGTYAARGTDNGPCQATGSDSLRLKPTLPSPGLEAGPPLQLCEGDTALIGPEPEAGIGYRWLTFTDLDQTGQSRAQLIATHPGADIYRPDVRRYVLEASTTAGCLALDTVQVTVTHKYALGPAGLPICNPVALEIPNVITPGQPGSNDELRITGLDYYQKTHLQIYNRYGRLVFDQRPYRQDWDATGLPAGVYYVHLTVQEINKQYRGWVEVVR